MATGRVPTTANSPLTAKGDLFTYSTAPARLAVGNNGETIVADSSTSTGLRYQAIQTRNCIYNSAYEIWQRGTSFTAPGYSADRWYASTGGVAGRTISRVAGTGQFQYLTRIQRTAGNTATNGVDFGQSFEIADATPYAGKTVTVSFYARKGADHSGTFSLYVFSGTSSTETNRVTSAYPSGAATPLNTGAISLTTTLARYQYTFTFGASVTQFCILPSMGFTGTAGAADYVEFTGFQLEVGSVATDYVRQGGSIQGELAACQRYYWRQTATAAGGAFGTGFFGTTTRARMFVNFPMSMRTTPSAIEYSAVGMNDNSTQFTVTALSLYENNKDTGVVLLSDVASGGTANRPCYLNYTTTSGYFALTAEL